MSHNIFRSTTGVPVTVALTSGHAVVVPPEGKPLHPRFHTRAVECGCMPTGAQEHKAVIAENFNRKATIEGGIRKLLDSSEEDAFTAQGVPSLNKLSRECGFRVEKGEMLTAWEKVKTEIAGDDGDDGDSDDSGQAGQADQQGANDDTNGDDNQ